MMPAYSRCFAASVGHKLGIAEEFGEADDRIERRAQLVADIGEQALAPVRGFGRRERDGSRAGRPHGRDAPAGARSWRATSENPCG